MHRQIKNIKLTVLTIILVFGINSCCTKKGCLGADDIYEISFHNFTQAELDTIIIISYVRNSDFTALIDSTVTKATENGGFFSAYTNNKIDTDLDYKVELISTGHVFTLTGFEIEKAGCNTCFPYRPESDFYNKLNSYLINGQKQAGSQITIFK
jgi:hypothetical protein